MSDHISTADLVIKSLIGQGIHRIFCLPGVQNDAFFDALYQAGDRIRAIHVRHEQTAGYMALGAALASGEPQAYCVVPGPGFLNTTAALATAYGVNAPVLALVGQIPSKAMGRGFGLLHELPDQLGIMERLTKWSGRLDGPEDASVKLLRAFTTMFRDKPGPIALECPMDVWAKTGRARPLDRPIRGRAPEPDVDAVFAAARALGDAENPMIIVGGGARHAVEQVSRLSEMLQAPVMSWRTGRGVMDDRNPFSISQPLGHRLWPDVDVVIGVGTRLQWPRQAWGVDDDLRVIHLDIEEDALTRCGHADVALHADAAEGLDALLAELPGHNRNRPDRSAEMIDRQAAMRAELEGALGPQLQWLDAIRAALPEDGMITDEMTQLGYVLRFAFPFHAPGQMLSTGYPGTLGWGYGAALGAKVACPERAVVCLTGDGGFMFAMPELATAMHHGINVVAIVMRDDAFGNVKRIQQQDYHGHVIASELSNPDFVQLADSFGALALRATTPDELREKLTEALAAERPAVIEVPVGEFPSPWGYISLPKVRGLE